MESVKSLLHDYGPGLGIYLLLVGIVGLFLGLRKGRGWQGAMMGALLGPIGWFLISRWDLRGKSCAECGGINPGNPRLCRHCGINLMTAAKRSQRSRVRDGTDGWR